MPSAPDQDKKTGTPTTNFAKTDSKADSPGTKGVLPLAAMIKALFDSPLPRITQESQRLRP